MPELKSFEEYLEKARNYICPDCKDTIGPKDLKHPCYKNHSIWHGARFVAMEEMLEAQRQAILSLQKEVEGLKKQLKPNN